MDFLNCNQKRSRIQSPVLSLLQIRIMYGSLIFSEACLYIFVLPYCPPILPPMRLIYLKMRESDPNFSLHPLGQADTMLLTFLDPFQVLTLRSDDLGEAP